MSTLFADTHPKMEALQIQLWREASPTRKIWANEPKVEDLLERALKDA
jgi:hypothetical protein